MPTCHLYLPVFRQHVTYNYRFRCQRVTYTYRFFDNVSPITTGSGHRLRVSFSLNDRLAFVGGLGLSDEIPRSSQRIHHVF